MKNDHDRTQKSKALKFSVANRWFPQYEVDVHSLSSIQESRDRITDIDTLASVPDYFRGFRDVIFDCKTGKKESAVNRSLWLSGLMNKLGASEGFCIFKKDRISQDYRLFAESLNVVLLTEEDFDVYSKSMTGGEDQTYSNCGNIDLWEEYFEKTKNFPKLVASLTFARSTYWMIEDAATACRKVIAELISVRPELNPTNKYHVCLFFHLASLLARSLAKMTNQIFKSYLHPEDKGTLAVALLHLLYGGKESYDHRNELFKRAKGQTENTPDALTLPNWGKFVDLSRQCLDSPRSIQRTPLSLMEAGLGFLKDTPDWKFLETLSSEDSHSSRFAMMLIGYLQQASKSPPEFSKICDQIFLPSLPVY